MNSEKKLKNPTKAIRSVIREGLREFTIDILSTSVSKKFDIPVETHLRKSLYQAAKRLALRGELEVKKNQNNRIQYFVRNSSLYTEHPKKEEIQPSISIGKQLSNIQADLIDFEDEYFTKMEAANFALKQIEVYPQMKDKLAALHQVKRQESLIALARSEVLSAMLDEH